MVKLNMVEINMIKLDLNEVIMIELNLVQNFKAFCDQTIKIDTF
jgi:hypothetical protein